MVQISELFDNELEAAILAINDIIKANHVVRDGAGLQVGKEWITPFSCYALFRLLSLYGDSCLVDSDVLESLRLGTNHPEDLL